MSGRLKKEFTRNAKLLEAATRVISAFSTQSEEGVKAALEVELISDGKPKQDENWRRLESFSEESESNPNQIVLPPGVNLDGPKQELKQLQSVYDYIVDDLPDDSTRNLHIDEVAIAMKNPPFTSLQLLATGLSKGTINK